MRFPFSLTRAMASYLLRQRLAGRQRFALVLMLEPLHACNLSCAGCGRIREYRDTLHCHLGVDDCLAAASECGAPIVSLCGGEPLIYPQIGQLVRELINRGRHVYLCTNGTLLEKKLAEFRPSSRLLVNVHLDGMEETHDHLAGRRGVFAAALAGIRAAKRAGFYVCTNTTLYRQTDIHELVVLFDLLCELGVDGLMLSPAFGYEAVRAETPEGDGLFMTRAQIRAKFAEARPLLERFKLTASPLYLDFLCGRRELPCAAWANPTFNVRGWRRPCYLLADGHAASYAELLQTTDWHAYGPGADPRCAHCLVHCGFEPAAVLSTPRRLSDWLRLAFWQVS